VEGNAIRGGFRGERENRAINDDFRIRAEFLFRFTDEYGRVTEEVAVGDTYVDFQRDITGLPQIAMHSHALQSDATHMRLHIVYNGQPTGPGNPLRIHDAFVFVTTNGVIHDHCSDTGRLMRTTNAGGVVEYMYDDYGNTTQLTVRRIDGRVEITRFEFFPNTHNLRQYRQYIVEDGVERLLTTTSYTYGAGGVLLSITVVEDGVTSVQTITYQNDFNDVATIRNAAGQIATFDVPCRYDNVITRTVGFDGVENAFVYDADGVLSRIENGAGNRGINYGFADDRLGNIRHNDTYYEFERNTLGQLVESRIAGQAMVTNTFDDDGNITETRFAGGTMGRFRPTFDGRGRIIQEQYFDGDGNLEARFSFLWGENGNVTRASSYDAQGRLDRSSDFSYDLAGRLTSVYTTDENPNSRVSSMRLRLGYDVNSALNRISLWVDGSLLSETHHFLDAQTRPYITEHVMLHALQGYEFIAMNRLSRSILQLPDGEQVITQLTYREMNGNATDVVESMVTTTPDGTEIGFRYVYDANGRIVAIYEDGATTPTHTFAYDAIGQMTRHNDTVFTYDNYGNILSAIGGGRNDVFTYRSNGWRDQLVAFNGQAITYDALGNMTSFAGRSYAWERAGLLREIRFDADYFLPDDFDDGYGDYFYAPPDYTIRYEYDHNGLRVRRITNGWVTDYIWMGNMLIARICDMYEIAWSYDAMGRMAGFTLNGVPYFYVRNLFGDVVAILDIDGNIVARYEYDAWGNLVSLEDFSFSGVGHINPIRYRGYYWDELAGMYYLVTRWYNPQLGRFISADIYFDTGHGVLGANMFAYAINNPIMFWDPMGTSPALLAFAQAAWSITKAVINVLYQIASWAYHTLVPLLNRVIEVAQRVISFFETYVIPIARGALDALAWMRSAQPPPVNRRLNTAFNAFFDANEHLFQTVIALSERAIAFSRTVIAAAEFAINAITIAYEVMSFLQHVVVPAVDELFERWSGNFYIDYEPDIIDSTVLGAHDMLSSRAFATERGGHVNLYHNFNAFRAYSRVLRTSFIEVPENIEQYTIQWRVDGPLLNRVMLTSENGNQVTVRTGGGEWSGRVTARLMGAGFPEAHIYVTVSTRANFAVNMENILLAPQLRGNEQITIQPRPGANVQRVSSSWIGTFREGDEVQVRGISGSYFQVIVPSTLSPRRAEQLGYVPISRTRPSDVRTLTRQTVVLTEASTLVSWPSTETRFRLNRNLPTLDRPINTRLRIIGEHGNYYYVDTGLQGANRFMFVRQDVVEEAHNIVWPIGPTHGTSLQGNGVNSFFGFRTFWRRNGTESISFHNGVDTPGRNPSNRNIGAPVYAIMDGTVWYVRPTYSGTGRGVFIILEHQVGNYTYYTLYQHLTRGSILFARGEPVSAGTPIARAGDTGSPGDLHLHFQIHRGPPGASFNEYVINPLPSYNNTDIRRNHQNPNPFFVLQNGQWVFNNNFAWSYGTGGTQREAFFTGRDATASRQNVFYRNNVNSPWRSFTP